MLYYMLVLLSVMTIIYFEKIVLNRRAILLVSSILILFFSVRHYTVGTDTPVYLDVFLRGYTFSDFTLDPDVEPFIQYLTYFVSLFTDNYFWFFFFCAIIVIPSHLIILKKYSEDYASSVFIFITFSFYTFFFNTLRSGIALALVMLSIPFLIQRKTLKYMLMMAVASFVHVSSLIMIPFYFILHFRKLSLEIKAAGLFLTSLGGASLLISYFASGNRRYEGYTEAHDSNGLLVMALFVAIGLVVYIFRRQQFFKEHVIYDKLSELYILGLSLLIPVAMLGVNPSGPQRLLYFFSCTLMLLIPIILKRLNSLLIYFAFYAFSVMYFYLATSKFSDLIPYSINPIFRVF